MAIKPLKVLPNYVAFADAPMKLAMQIITSMGAEIVKADWPMRAVVGMVEMSAKLYWQFTGVILLASQFWFRRLGGSSFRLSS